MELRTITKVVSQEIVGVSYGDVFKCTEEIGAYKKGSILVALEPSVLSVYGSFKVMSQSDGISASLSISFLNKHFQDGSIVYIGNVDGDEDEV